MGGVGYVPLSRVNNNIGIEREGDDGVVRVRKYAQVPVQQEYGTIQLHRMEPLARSAMIKPLLKRWFLSAGDQ